MATRRYIPVRGTWYQVKRLPIDSDGVVVLYLHQNYLLFQYSRRKTGSLPYATRLPAAVPRLPHAYYGGGCVRTLSLPRDGQANLQVGGVIFTLVLS